MPRIARLAAFALAALLFFGLPSLVSLYTDWLWFGETGYRGIFTTTLVTRVLLGLITFAVTFGWLLLNLRLALASLRFAGPILWTGQQGVQIELPGKRQLARLAMIAAAVVGLPAALYGASSGSRFSAGATRCRSGPQIRCSATTSRSTCSRSPSSSWCADC